MKKFYTLALASLISCTLTAQIVVGEFEFKSGGNVFAINTDTLTTGMTVGASGTGQTWDFSNLANHGSFDLEFEFASWTPYQADFPTSNAAINNGNSNYVFFTHNNTGFYSDGIVEDVDGNGSQDKFRYDDNLKRVQFPITYNDTFSDVAHGLLRLPGGTVNGQNYDSAHYQSYVTTIAHVESAGSITIPMGTYDALRAKIQTETKDSIFAFVLGQKILFQEIAFTSYELEWYSDHADIGGILMTAQTDATFSNLEGAEYVAAPRGVGITEVNDFEIKSFPNPTSGTFVISSNDSEFSADLELFDIAGKLVHQTAVTGEATTIDLSGLQSGLYFYHLVKDGNVIRKDKVQVQK